MTSFIYLKSTNRLRAKATMKNPLDPFIKQYPCLSGAWIENKEYEEGRDFEIEYFNASENMGIDANAARLIAKEDQESQERKGLSIQEQCDMIVAEKDQEIRELKEAIIHVTNELRRSHNMVLRNLDVNWKYKKLFLMLAGISGDTYETH